MPKPCSHAATHPVCLRQTRLFWSPSSPLGCSVCLVQAIQGFVSSRRIYTRNLAARKRRTRLHAPVKLPACFLSSEPRAPTRACPDPRVTWPAPRPARDPSSLLTSALPIADVSPKKKKKKGKRLTHYFFVFFCRSFLYFLFISNGYHQTSLDCYCCSSFFLIQEWFDILQKLLSTGTSSIWMSYCRMSELSQDWSHCLQLPNQASQAKSLKNSSKAW